MKWLSRPNVAQEIFAATNSRRGAIIDRELNRMRIPEPKDFQNEGRGIRNCPLFLELRPILDEAFEIVGDKSEYVVAAPPVPLGGQHARLRGSGVFPVYPRYLETMRRRIKPSTRTHRHLPQRYRLLRPQMQRVQLPEYRQQRANRCCRLQR
jgi:hypothetical protein